jgi:hypothetical protein
MERDLPTTKETIMLKFCWLCFNTKGVNHPAKNYYSVFYDEKLGKDIDGIAKPMAMDDFGTLFELRVVK